MKEADKSTKYPRFHKQFNQLRKNWESLQVQPNRSQREKCTQCE